MRATAYSLALLMAAASSVDAAPQAKASQNAAKLPEVRIGIVLDGPVPEAGDFCDPFIAEIKDIAEGEFKVSFPADKRLHGRWTTESIAPVLDKLSKDPEVDVILTLGVVASHAAGMQKKWSKLTIGAFVVDPELQALPYKDGTSGVDNFTYTTAPDQVRRDLEIFKEIYPFENLTVILSWGLPLQIEAVQQKRDRIAGLLGLKSVHFIEATKSPQEVLAALDATKTDAVYIAPIEQFDHSQYRQVLDGLKSRKIPSFAYGGRDDVVKGALAGVSSGGNIERTARRVALNLQRVLLGEKTNQLKVIVPRKERLVINMQTAKAIGYYPKWAVLTEAELVSGESKTKVKQITLPQVIQMALQRNLELATKGLNLRVQANEIDIARAKLFPTVELNATGSLIDEDRAATSFGNQGRAQLNVGGTIYQILYSERAYANLSINKYLQSSREYQFDQAELDTILDTSTAYLDVLRAKAFERIRRNNLALTRSNLELAEVRRSIGAAGPSEVYRWQSQLAQDRSAVIKANAQRNAAEIALNRMLNRPLEAKVSIDEEELKDPIAAFGATERIKYLDNPWSFRVYRAFMVKEGLDIAPELKAIDKAIAAQNRGLKSVARGFFLPDFLVQGQLSQVVARDVVESEPPTDPMTQQLLGSIGNQFSQDDTTWSLSLVASYKIFSGTERIYQYDQAQMQLQKQKLERQQIAQLLEQRIRATIHLSGASFANIALSETAAETAQKNLEVVKSAYARGSTSYLNLLDAQNVALTAKQVAANSIYDFLADQMRVERSVARFNFRKSNQENTEWLQRLSNYLNKAKEAQQ